MSKIKLPPPPLQGAGGPSNLPLQGAGGPSNLPLQGAGGLSTLPLQGAGGPSNLPLQGAGGLSIELTKSLRRPSGRTLRLIDKALAWLRPFESPKAQVTSATERRALLDMLSTHRMILCPYIDLDRIESNLRRAHLT